MEQVIIQVLYCIGVAAMVTIGCLSGLLVFFILFGCICMRKEDMRDTWRSLWRARVK
jgi:hypothetical protein